MTDYDPNTRPTITIEIWQDRNRDAARLAEETLSFNKATLFDALVAAHIDRVTVTFDGCGDSGQIESLDATANDAPIPLPATPVEIATWSWGDVATRRRALPLAEAIETVVYACLGHAHGGWENNEGAYGEFVFDTATRSIRLDYRERYVDTHVSQHVF